MGLLWFLFDCTCRLNAMNLRYLYLYKKVRGIHKFPNSSRGGVITVRTSLSAGSVSLPTAAGFPVLLRHRST